MEIWKPIPNYEGYYEVSNLGNIRSLPRKVIRRNGTSFTVAGKLIAVSIRDRYPIVNLHKDGKSKYIKIHRIVLLSFIGPPPKGKPYGCHIDDDRSNNTLKNLKWGSPQDNVHDAIRNGTFQLGEKHFCAKITDKQALEILEKFNKGGISQQKLADQYSVTRDVIYKLVHRKSFKHLGVKTTL